uniref:BTB domain-containing protein n=2 Tax=Meloidogyne TaxID=189290 RepID=A0A915LFQ0_MELJA
MDYPLVGIDCYGMDRDVLNDFAKYYNNAHLSDLTLVVGEEIYPAHRLILCRSSEVFDRMLSQKWHGEKREIELTEEPQCQAVFGQFLRFQYCNHVVLNSENALPILILADKYNVTCLKKICIEFAIKYVLPDMKLKELFHFWFNYSTKAFHQSLIKVCIEILAKEFKQLMTSAEWEREWLDLDRDQLVEFLRSNELVVPNEYFVWESVLKWLNAPAHPERRGNTCAPLLAQILPYIRFPFMTAEQLYAIEVEEPLIVKLHEKLFRPYTHLAFKFISLPLASRVKLINTSNDTNGTQFLLRNYTDIQWDKKMYITSEQLRLKNHDHTFKIFTKSSSLTLPRWEWKLDFQIVQNLSCVNDELRVTLTAVDVDHTGRSVEYMLMICSERKVLRTITDKKFFSKSRYSQELDIRGKLEANELLDTNSALLRNDKALQLQLLLRPII